jgi:ABC-type Fe2+-enterobactin transport system substrate-binding protein
MSTENRIVRVDNTVTCRRDEGEVVTRTLNQQSLALWKLFEGYRESWDELHKTKAQITQGLREQYETFIQLFSSYQKEIVEGVELSDHRWQALAMEANTFGMTVQTQLSEVHRKFGVVEQAYMKDRE